MLLECLVDGAVALFYIGHVFEKFGDAVRFFEKPRISYVVLVLIPLPL